MHTSRIKHSNVLPLNYRYLHCSSILVQAFLAIAILNVDPDFASEDCLLLFAIKRNIKNARCSKQNYT